MRKFDIGRPGTARKHAPTGSFVCMYTDDPGVYMNYSGHPVSEDQAAEAGYDVEANKLERKRQELRAKALSEVDAKMARIEQDVDAMVNAAPAAAGEEAAQPAAEAQPLSVTSDRPEPAVLKDNAKGEPRETARRKMEGGQAGRWMVIDKASGDVVHPEAYVDTRTAEAYLMERIA